VAVVLALIHPGHAARFGAGEALAGNHCHTDEPRNPTYPRFYLSYFVVSSRFRSSPRTHSAALHLQVCTTLILVRSRQSMRHQKPGTGVLQIHLLFLTYCCETCTIERKTIKGEITHTSRKSRYALEWRGR
jgi:hypothetical protein